MKTMKWVIPMSLQAFAQAGDVLNATNGYNNAYTGHHDEFLSPNDLSSTMKTYYDTELLENYRTQRVYGQFAFEQPLPKGRGKTVEFRKWNTFAKAEKLVEGVIPTGQKFGQTAITANVDQYGTYTAITDVLNTHAFDPIILGATEEMGASAATTDEALIRDGLLAGKNVLYCDNLTTAGIVKDTPTSPATMGWSSANGYCRLTGRMVNRARTIMRKNKVPTIRGYYYMVLHPSIAEELRNDSDWKSAHEYASPEEIYNGEIGRLHGFKFIENADAPVLKGSGYTNAESGATYPCYAFGMKSFARIKPDGQSLRMIVKPASVVGGPLEQFSTVGYKMETNGATILYPERLLRVMATCSASKDDEPTDS